MTPDELAEAGSGSALASWTPLLVLLSIYAAIVIALALFGRPRRPASGALDAWIARTSGGLSAVTGFPGWACAAAGTSLYGLLIAGFGFYDDVAWHIALGRDEVLFTAPHTAIVIGLAMLLLGAVLGIVFATFDGAPVGRRVGALTVPWSTIPLGVLGLSALSGFPLDEIWHAEYGIDVTMWSPTHLLMILGASLSGMASWLVLAEAGVSPRSSKRALAAHVAAGWLTLQGLAAVQGEFSFGVPQFQQLYHPVLVLLAGAAALVAIRIVLGPWWPIAVAVAGLALFDVDVIGDGRDGSPVETRGGGIYLASAVAVELVARWLGTGSDARGRLRFAVVSGLGVATLGLAGEWVWNTGARQPWTTALLPDAVLLGGIVAVGAAVLGAALGRSVAREPRRLVLPRWAVLGAAVLVVVGLALPLPRRVGDVTADLRILPTGDGRTATVEVALDPPDAADGARWFQAMSWQGGELVLADMQPLGDGTWRSEDPVPVEGAGKAMVRLHRGAELMAVPIRLPADPEIDAPEIPAVDRVQAFTGEAQYLLREQQGGSAWLQWVVYGLLAGVAALWAACFSLAGRRIGDGGLPERAPQPAGHPG